MERNKKYYAKRCKYFQTLEFLFFIIVVIIIISCQTFHIGETLHQYPSSQNSHLPPTHSPTSPFMLICLLFIYLLFFISSLGYIKKISYLIYQ